MLVAAERISPHHSCEHINEFAWRNFTFLIWARNGDELSNAAWLQYFERLLPCCCGISATGSKVEDNVHLVILQLLTPIMFLVVNDFSGAQAHHQISVLTRAHTDGVKATSLADLHSHRSDS